MNETPQAINWNLEKFKAFRKATNECIDDTFTFEGHEFVTSYAKYLVQHLTNVFSPTKE